MACDISTAIAAKLVEMQQAGIVLSDEEFAELATAIEQIEADRLRTDLHAFVREAWPVVEPGTPFVDGWHVGAICEHLERASRGELTRLVVNVPPRSTKSTIVSVMWPAWVWASNPSFRWLCVSHSDRLAVEHARKMRTLVTSDWFQGRWPTPFSRDQNQKSRFDNDSGGYRIAATVRSGITGLGGDALVLDDPHDRDEAVSDIERRACIDAYREKLSTRLNDPQAGIIVAIGQRLHEQDLFGWLIESGFKRLVIPMRFERDHPVATNTGWRDPRECDGELMCPQRFGERHVREQEVVLGSWAFAGQYQQRPTPRGGGLFKADWFKIVKAGPAAARRVRYWDKAASESPGACFTAGVLMAERGGRYWIEDVVRQKCSPDGRRRLMRMTAALDAQRDESTQQVIEREGGSTGLDAVLDEARLLAGYNVHHHRPVGSKLVRLEPLAAQFEAGNAVLVKGKWNRVFIDELLGAGAGGRHMDQADAASGAFAWLASESLSLASARAAFGPTDDAELRRPMTTREVAELPDFLRELVEEHGKLAINSRWKRGIHDKDED